MEIELKPARIRTMSLLIVCVAAATIFGSAGNAQENPSDHASVSANDDGELTDSNQELLDAINSLDKTIDGTAEPDKTWLRNRLQGLSVVGGGVLALLGVLFAYLRLDHATRGFYGGRLQLIGAMAASAILAICYYLWTQVLFS